MPEAPLAITMGDPAGIGPEVVLRALQPAHGSWARRAVVLGCPRVMQRQLQQLEQATGFEPMHMRVLHGIDEMDALPAALLQLRQGEFALIAVPDMPEDAHTLPWGRVDARAGQAAAACIRAAVQGAMQGHFSGLVTAPVHKEALALAGVPYAGHTDYLQALATRPGQSPPLVRMMLSNQELSVVLVTVHCPVRQALAQITTDAVFHTLRLAHQSLHPRAGFGPLRMAVAGLNPHAGEGGLLGDEEIRILQPAISQAQAAGMWVQGPFPPDTVFMRARHTPNHPGAFDVVISMLHDHGLIAVKYLGLEHGVNTTLGLPFVRTSPDHGTAFDIAGLNQADPRSFLAALQAAWQQATARQEG
jgi:4-hydroxythreonine-4-phosphate dehydrogenase